MSSWAGVRGGSQDLLEGPSYPKSWSPANSHLTAGRGAHPCSGTVRGGGLQPGLWRTGSRLWGEQGEGLASCRSPRWGVELESGEMQTVLMVWLPFWSLCSVFTCLSPCCRPKSMCSYPLSLRKLVQKDWVSNPVVMISQLINGKTLTFLRSEPLFIITVLYRWSLIYGGST